MTVLSLPPGDQANPKRGAQLIVSVPRKVRPGWPGSSGYTAYRRLVLDCVSGVVRYDAQFRLQTGLELCSPRNARVSLQALVDPPLILPIEAESPQGNRLCTARGEVLLEHAGHAVVEITDRSDDRQRIGEGAEGVIGDVVAAEVSRRPSGCARPSSTRSRRRTGTG